MIYSIYKGNGELSSRGLNISPQTMNMNIYSIYNVWQPSLVLGRLGEALNGPHGSQEPYPNLLALHAY